MSQKWAAQSERDDVDRANDQIRRAAGKLVQLIGSPVDGSLINQRAARALIDLGAYAVKPLAAGLHRAHSPLHRCAILLLIHQLATGPILEVIQILGNVARKDPDDRVRHLALGAISTMADREMMAMIGAAKGRATGAAATSPGPKPPPDGCTPAPARADAEGR